MKPIRIKLERKKGWRKPPNTIVVSRPGKWGNPFLVSDYWGISDNPNATAVAAFKKWIYEPNQDEFRQEVKDKLADYNLA